MTPDTVRVKYPLVSIVLCCHNRRDYLEQTLRSVFAQQYQPVEVIVMDDGSTDGTEALMQQYSNQVRYFRQSRQGIAAARSNASRLARGDYIAYQDDDDLMPPRRIVALYEALEQFPEASFATGDFAVIDADGNVTGQRWMPGPLDVKEPPVLLEDGHAAVLWPKIPAVPHTTLFRRELGERIGWFDLAFRYACSDADFLARLGQLGPVAYVREVVSYYRRGHAALWANDVRTSCSRVQLWEKHLDLLDHRLEPTRQSDPGRAAASVRGLETAPTGDSAELRTRLEERLLGVILRLERYRQEGPRDPEFDLDAYVARGLAKLPLRRRLHYRTHSLFRIPLRRLIRRDEAADARPENETS